MDIQRVIKYLFVVVFISASHIFCGDRTGGDRTDSSVVSVTVGSEKKTSSRFILHWKDWNQGNSGDVSASVLAVTAASILTPGNTADHSIVRFRKLPPLKPTITVSQNSADECRKAGWASPGSRADLEERVRNAEERARKVENSGKKASSKAELRKEVEDLKRRLSQVSVRAS